MSSTRNCGHRFRSTDELSARPFRPWLADITCARRRRLDRLARAASRQLDDREDRRLEGSAEAALEGARRRRQRLADRRRRYLPRALEGGGEERRACRGVRRPRPALPSGTRRTSAPLSPAFTATAPARRRPTPRARSTRTASPDSSPASTPRMRRPKLLASRHAQGIQGQEPFARQVSASPLVDGDRVCLPVGGSAGASALAFDKNTGNPVWKSGNDKTSYAPPNLIHGRRQKGFLS